MGNFLPKKDQTRSVAALSGVLGAMFLSACGGGERTSNSTNKLPINENNITLVNASMSSEKQKSPKALRKKSLA